MSKNLHYNINSANSSSKTEVALMRFFTIFCYKLIVVVFLFRDHLMPSQQRQRSVDSPVEVKQEPFEEEMNEGYEEEYPNEEYEDYGEEDVEGDVDQEFAQDTEEGIYGEGEYQDEDDDGEVQYDDEEAYQQ